MQKKKTVAWKLAKGGFIYYCRADDSTCSKLYTTPGGVNMTTNHNCKDLATIYGTCIEAFAGEWE